MHYHWKFIRVLRMITLGRDYRRFFEELAAIWVVILNFEFDCRWRCSYFYAGWTHNGCSAIWKRTIDIGGFSRFHWSDPFEIESAIAWSTRLSNPIPLFLSNGFYSFFSLSFGVAHWFGWPSDCPMQLLQLSYKPGRKICTYATVSVLQWILHFFTVPSKGNQQQCRSRNTFGMTSFMFMWRHHRVCFRPQHDCKYIIYTIATLTNYFRVYIWGYLLRSKPTLSLSNPIITAVF